MVSLATLGVVMMGGMGVGVFTNAGLVNSEIKEKCKIINELHEEIDKVKEQGKDLVVEFHIDRQRLKELSDKTTESIESLKKKILEFKDGNKNKLDREEYIYTSLVITIILILITKMILTRFFKDKIK